MTYPTRYLAKPTRLPAALRATCAHPAATRLCHYWGLHSGPVGAGRWRARQLPRARPTATPAVRAGHEVVIWTVVKVLIAGCGYVGSALGAELLADGDEVWGLRRDPAQLPPGVSRIAADLQSPADLQQLPAKLDAVVYCVGADESTDAAYQRAYVTGLTHLLHALERREVQRIYFTSSTAVYAQGDGQWLTESSETAPTHFSGVRLLEAERLLQEHRVPATILRCSGIYGPGRTRLIESVRQGTARGSARHTNRIHRDDVAGAVRHLLRAGTAPDLLLLTDDEPAPERDVLGYVAKCLGVPEPLAAASAAPSRPGDKRCSNARLRATGYSLRYPTYREGYSALLAEAAGA